MPTSAETPSSRGPSHRKKRHEAVDLIGESKRQNSYVVIYDAQPAARVAAIKSGVPAAFVGLLADQMGRPKEWLLPRLGISIATFNRKKKESKALSKDDGERALGMARLVGQVESMVRESGDPTGFDAAQWVAQWLEEPSPALGGKKPSDYMDTSEGQGIIFNLLAQVQAGTYA